VTVTANRDDVLQTYRRHLSRGRAALAELSAAPLEVSSHDTRLVTPEGEEFLDCGGYGVFILGHCHPAVVEAVVRQVRSHPVHSGVLVEPVQARAAATLASVSPPGLESVRFANSGSEATEFALKLARLHGKRHIVTTANGFHGKTLGALSATSKRVYQDRFAPLLPGTVVPYGDAAAIKRVVAGRSDCCVILEPIQGEGGVVIPPPGYLADVCAICREHGALVIFDEIQVGLGRTGRWWAAERDGAVPDVMLVGKALSGGIVPVAAVVTTEELYRPFSEDPMLHSSTFAGSPIACAAAHAAIEAIRSEGVVERAAAVGAELLGRVQYIVRPFADELVREVRGAGLLIGIEFQDAGAVTETMLELLDRRVVVSHSHNAQSVLRLTPPAILTPADIDRVTIALADSLRAVSAVNPPV
jgi:putrescine aminotransferase